MAGRGEFVRKLLDHIPEPVKKLLKKLWDHLVDLALENGVQAHLESLTNIFGGVLGRAAENLVLDPVIVHNLGKALVGQGAAFGNRLTSPLLRFHKCAQPNISESITYLDMFIFIVVVAPAAWDLGSRVQVMLKQWKDRRMQEAEDEMLRIRREQAIDKIVHLYMQRRANRYGFLNRIIVIVSLFVVLCYMFTCCIQFSPLC
jgi:hypothetical protein